MDEAAITKYIADTLGGVDVLVGSREAGSPEIAWGDTFFIYDPDRNLEPKHQNPFATIVTKDYGEFDRASNLDRPGVFRLNVGVSKPTFQSLFPARDADHDFTALDQIMPHPVYGKMYWVCVLNPSETTFGAVKPLLAEAYSMAVARHGKRRSEG
jgi:Family of unknown function (DUF6194)